MKWFKHDTDASIDSKLQELMLDYGATGYGLYWYCVELIAQNVDKDNITFELEHDARIIARNLNLTVAETTNMMKKMVELNLFSFSENNKLACYALAKRLDQSMTSNADMRKIITKLKDNNHDLLIDNHDGVMTESCLSHDKVMQEEKRREEKREEEIKKPLFKSKNFNDDEVNSIIDYRKSIKSPLKTQMGYTGLENKLIEVMSKFEITLIKALKIMASKEWKSIEVEWMNNSGYKIKAKKTLGGVL